MDKEDARPDPSASDFPTKGASGANDEKKPELGFSVDVGVEDCEVGPRRSITRVLRLLNRLFGAAVL